MGNFRLDWVNHDTKELLLIFIGVRIQLGLCRKCHFKKSIVKHLGVIFYEIYNSLENTSAKKIKMWSKYGKTQTIVIPRWWKYEFSKSQIYFLQSAFSESFEMVIANITNMTFVTYYFWCQLVSFGVSFLLKSPQISNPFPTPTTPRRVASVCARQGLWD